MKYWEILLEKQRQRGKDGSTIPFLIGSQKYLTQTQAYQNIEELITDIITNYCLEINIRFCIATQTFILEISKGKNKVYYPTFKNEEQLQLSVSSFSKGDLGNSIEILIEKLTEEFQGKIDDELFSAEPNVYARNANWRTFTVEDINFIQENFESEYNQ